MEKIFLILLASLLASCGGASASPLYFPGCVSCAPPGCNCTYGPTIAYNDAHLQYLGRWNDSGTYKWSAWGGTQVVFQVKGTLNVTMNVTYNNPSGSGGLFMDCYIDNTPYGTGDSPLAQVNTVTSSTSSGTKSTTCTLPDTGLHTIILHTNGYHAYIQPGTAYQHITSYTIDTGGYIQSWAQGTNILQTVGDSWAAADEDYPRLMNRAKWVLYPVATGGMTIAQMLSDWPYTYGTTAETDPQPYALTIESGVNDYNASVSTGSFQTSAQSLVNLVRAKWGTGVPIFLIVPPDNLNISSRNYGEYKSVEQTIASGGTNIYVCDGTALDATVQTQWLSDNEHLNYLGKQNMANFEDTCISNAGF